MANQSLYNELARDIAGLGVAQANLLANQNECCCSTKMLIQQSNYEGAMRDAATNANFSAQIQSVKDMIAQNKIEALQSEDDKRIADIEQGNKVTQRAILALLEHAIDGNNKNQLIRAKDNLNDYLTDR